MRKCVYEAWGEYKCSNIKEGFEEVETQTLMHSATGASAKPYITHNNGLDIDVFLRI